MDLRFNNNLFLVQWQAAECHDRGQPHENSQGKNSIKKYPALWKVADWLIIESADIEIYKKNIK